MREIKKNQIAIDKIKFKNNVGEMPGWATWDAQQASDYIENNVVDLASAKQVLKAMAKLLIYLRDK